MKTKNFKLKIIFSFAAIFFLFLPFFAANASLVPCGSAGKPACNFCFLLQMGQNIINFLVYDIAIPLVAVFIVVGGFYIMTAADSADRAKKGRDIIKTAIVGLIILLLSWIFVDILFRVIGGSAQPTGFNAPWYDIGRNVSCGG